jgi:hypothetical protein
MHLTVGFFPSCCPGDIPHSLSPPICLPLLTANDIAEQAAMIQSTLGD